MHFPWSCKATTAEVSRVAILQLSLRFAIPQQSPAMKTCQEAVPLTCEAAKNSQDSTCIDHMYTIHIPGRCRVFLL